MDNLKPVTITTAGRIPLTKKGLEHLGAKVGDVIMLIPLPDGKIMLEKYQQRD